MSSIIAGKREARPRPHELGSVARLAKKKNMLTSVIDFWHADTRQSQDCKCSLVSRNRETWFYTSSDSKSQSTETFAVRYSVFGLSNCNLTLK